MIRGPFLWAALVLPAAAWGCSEPPVAVVTPAEPDPTSQTVPAEAVELVLAVEGMVCQGCANEAANAAASISGVVEAHGVFENGTVVVQYIPTSTTPEEIAQTISGADRGGAPDFVATAP